jgi:hypothetical protein
MNKLIKLAKCNDEIIPGDIFVISLVKGKFVYGKVVKTSFGVFRRDDILVYFYKTIYKDKNQQSNLSLKDILLEPLIVEYANFRNGYFEKVGHVKNDETNTFQIHYFYDSLLESYVDEYHNKVDKRTNAMFSILGLSTRDVLSDIIQEALEGKHKLNIK